MKCKTEIALVLSTSEEREKYFQTKEGRKFKWIAIFMIAAFMFSYIFSFFPMKF